MLVLPIGVLSVTNVGFEFILCDNRMNMKWYLFDPLVRSDDTVLFDEIELIVKTVLSALMVVELSVLFKVSLSDELSDVNIVNSL